MYLTDFREYTLKDVIQKFEPELFRKVTGLTKSDFDLFVSLNVFNSALMNDAVYNFKRYEDASLGYTGIAKHKDPQIGGFDTVLPRKDFEGIYGGRPSQSLQSAPINCRLHVLLRGRSISQDHPADPGPQRGSRGGVVDAGG